METIEHNLKTTARRTVRSWLVRAEDGADYLTVLQYCRYCICREGLAAWRYDREFYKPTMDLDRVVDGGFYNLRREESGLWRYQVINEHF